MAMVPYRLLKIRPTPYSFVNLAKRRDRFDPRVGLVPIRGVEAPALDDEIRAPSGKGRVLL